MNFSQVNFGFFAFKIYGTLLALAFFIAVWHFYRRLKSYNLSADFFVHHFWKWLLAGFFMGRILALILDPAIFGRHDVFAFFTFWEGSIHFFGFLVGFLGFAYWDCRREGQNILRWLDAAMPSFLMGVLIVDLAGFLTGAIYGKQTSLPWGIQYETFGVDILYPVHPVTIYAFFLHFILFLWAKKRKLVYDKFPGRLSIRVGIFYFLTDLFLQFYRGDVTVILWSRFRIEMFFDLFILLFLFYLLSRQK
jgi:phosphatidylglycerol:prolipoprotein diacylglycerol transferase